MHYDKKSKSVCVFRVQFTINTIYKIKPKSVIFRTTLKYILPANRVIFICKLQKHTEGGTSDNLINDNQLPKT